MCYNNCIRGDIYMLIVNGKQDNPDNQLITVFKDSEMIKEYSLSEICNRLWNGKF